MCSFWSAVTCRRFLLLQIDFHKKAATGRRTPKDACHPVTLVLLCALPDSPLTSFGDNDSCLLPLFSSYVCSFNPDKVDKVRFHQHNNLLHHQQQPRRVVNLGQVVERKRNRRLRLKKHRL